ncbi:MAG: Cof-type HAD-IIB family hydrolase [Acidobacteria bacterium]|nr:Cof-type HAD-IIB family hydrolase [Acidobacteriota bacterium]
MPIKLLALDIDGTLLTPRGELTPRNSAAINRARELGVLVVLVTGRRFNSARELVQKLELDIPLVSHNGALTKNIETLETLDFHPLDTGIARSIIGVGREFGADMICCDDPDGLGTMVIEGVSPDNKSLHRYLEKYRDSVVEVSDLLEYVDHAPIQMMFSGRCDPMDEFAGNLKAAMGKQIQLFKTRYRSVDLTILDALSVTASKGASLETVAQKHGVAREEVMAIGDNHNDLTMLRYANLGVVMANAEDELKEMGFEMTSSNEEDGVAEAIERHILQ